MFDQFLRFSVVGVVGFVVDAGVLTALTLLFSMNLYVARACSFLAAVTTTWALNRTYTFPGAVAMPMILQWTRFSTLNALGGLVNLGSYALLVSHITVAHNFPVLAVAVGSLCGLLVNFSLSKIFVFRKG